MKTISPAKRLVLMLSAMIMLLCVPLLAMQFTDEVKWTALDFMAAAILLVAGGAMLELLWRKVPVKSHRIMYSVGVFLLFLVIWVELAVGI
ncbi:hypothetical protein [Sphingobacterium deserti]|uniref:Uncharacterized protein n=1 Tax=Sphingobacterium deserti TaxID=1229276 RepID=A0A0B8T4D7_9SPHI|nr:hypothetical protein [Sphingobacterium deserti]KGE14498.1 hypothetical protein DI53_1527 [Sphingobacterium deserti]